MLVPIFSNQTTHSRHTRLGSMGLLMATHIGSLHFEHVLLNERANGTGTSHTR